MDRSDNIIDALEDLIIGYADDASGVGHVAFVARREIQDLRNRLDVYDAEIRRMRELLKQAGIEMFDEHKE